VEVRESESVDALPPIESINSFFINRKARANIEVRESKSGDIQPITDKVDILELCTYPYVYWMTTRVSIEGE
jgi:hypothetical protein